MIFTIENETEMLAFGQRLASRVQWGTVIHLHGDLGVGKTTLCRSVIMAMGHKGRVKSPTYTLVEPYELEAGTLYHFDLYRLAEPSELEYVGYRDYFSSEAICLIEWPERGADLLDEPDLDICIEMAGEQRKLICSGKKGLGEQLLNLLSET